MRHDIGNSSLVGIQVYVDFWDIPFFPLFCFHHVACFFVNGFNELGRVDICPDEMRKLTFYVIVGHELLFPLGEGGERVLFGKLLQKERLFFEIPNESQRFQFVVFIVFNKKFLYDDFFSFSHDWFSFFCGQKYVKIVNRMFLFPLFLIKRVFFVTFPVFLYYIL